MDEPLLTRNLAKRMPSEESMDLYPALVVDDDRVAGSITLGRSRLPLWAFVGMAVDEGWSAAIEAYDHIEDEYDWDRKQAGDFVRFLLEPRGELARLLLVLADVERRSEGGPHWSEKRADRQTVIDQLKRCVDVLEHDA